MRAVQQRIVAEIERLARKPPNETVALISHGNVIKAALMHFLGLPLDNIMRFEVSPASVSAVAVNSTFSQVRLINDTGEMRR